MNPSLRARFAGKEHGMTEGEKAFYKRRLREELHQARVSEHPNLCLLHERWAQLYQDRLDGVPRARLVFPPAPTAAEPEAIGAEVCRREDIARAA
jgi:hypothetical protein